MIPIPPASGRNPTHHTSPPISHTHYYRSFISPNHHKFIPQENTTTPYPDTFAACYFVADAPHGKGKFYLEDGGYIDGYYDNNELARAVSMM